MLQISGYDFNIVVYVFTPKFRQLYSRVRVHAEVLPARDRIVLATTLLIQGLVRPLGNSKKHLLQRCVIFAAMIDLELLVDCYLFPICRFDSFRHGSLCNINKVMSASHLNPPMLLAPSILPSDTQVLIFYYVLVRPMPVLLTLVIHSLPIAQVLLLQILIV